MVVPEALATCAEVAVAVPGHQATSDPVCDGRLHVAAVGEHERDPGHVGGDLPLQERTRLPAAGREL